MKRPIYAITCLGTAFALSGCGIPYYDTEVEEVTAAPAAIQPMATAPVRTTQRTITTAPVQTASVEPEPEEDEAEIVPVAATGPTPFLGRHVPVGINRTGNGGSGGGLGGGFSGGDEGGGWGG